MAAGERRILRDDPALLAAARSGDTDAFGELYRRYLGDVRAFCARRVGDPIRAEDLAQDTFVKAFERIGTFRPGAALWPWLSTIARNLCIDENRRHRRIVEEAAEELPESADLVAVPLDPTPETAIDRDTRNRIGTAIASAMAHLSPRERRLIIRSAVNGEAWSEIALAEHSSLDAVRNAAWRARGVLRNILGDAARDLRTWIGLSIPAAVKRLKHAWGRRRLRFAGDWMASLMISEHVGGIAIVLVVFSTTLFPEAPGIPPREPPDLASAAVPSVEATTANETRTGPSGRPEQRKMDVIAETTHASVDAAAARRPKAAGPSSAAGELVIYGPSDQAIYWHEASIWCGDGRKTALLPEWSPVRAVC